jgi:hypothetical protein
MIRTCDPLIRSQVLYPTELRVLFGMREFEYKEEVFDCQARDRFEFRVSSFGFREETPQ